jgi:hypothetical protein
LKKCWILCRHNCGFGSNRPHRVKEHEGVCLHRPKSNARPATPICTAVTK